MSGVGEAALVLGLISSSVSVFQAAYDVYEAANSAHGLPKKLKTAADQIPIVLHALGLAEENVQNLEEGALKEAKPILERCKSNADIIQDIFDKNLPSKDDSRTERYRKSAALKLKSGQVQERMKEVLADLDLLATHQVFQDAQVIADIKAVIEELKAEDDSTKTENTHHGSGNINYNTGSGVQKNTTLTNTGSGKQYVGEKQYFGRDAGEN